MVEQPGFLINLENSYASGKVKRPRGPRSNLTLLRPHFDLEARALAYYFRYHVLARDDVSDIAQSLCACLTIWKASGLKSTMVDLALSSVSLAVFSRVEQHPEAGLEASSKYSLLLRTVKEHIAQFQFRLTTFSERTNVDDCLLTMFLMGRYEATMPATSSTASLQKSFHHEGALAILKVSMDSLNPPLATSITKFGRRGLIRSSLRRKSPLPDWILDGERFGEHGLELEFDRIFVNAVNLHYRSGLLEQCDNGMSATLLGLANQARELDDSLRDWAGRLPSAWAYQRHTLTEPGPWPMRYFYCPTVYSFQTLGYAAAWTQYFVTRMLINSIRLRLLDLSRLDPCLGSSYGQREWLESSILLNSMTDYLAFTMPFALGKINVQESPNSETVILINSDKDMKPCLAALVVWQLTLASSLERIDPKQQQWFRAETARLGRRIGNRILESAETSEWTML